MGRLHLALLGTPEVRHAERVLAFPTRKALALLIYLVTKESLHPREKLTALLWPESDEEHGRMALRRTLALLRQSLDEGSTSQGGMHLLVEREALGFNLASDFDLDLHRLNTASALIRSQIRPFAEQGTEVPDETRRHLLSGLQEAVKVYRGEFLEGLSLGDAADFDDWISAQRAYWQRQMEGIFNRLSQLQFEGGEIVNAIETTTRWVTHDPLNEAAYRRLMRLHHAAGDRHSALEIYETCRAVLEQELQTEPALETEALAERIRAKIAPGSNQSRGSTRPPFVEAPLIGRATEHTILVTAYRKVRREGPQVLTLTGEAGIGKTRLASEFLRWATAQGADILQGRAFETGGRLPYQPLVEALRSRVERENAPDNLLNDVWLAELSRLLPELRDRYPDLPPLLTLGEAEARTRFFEAVALLCQALAEQAPLVFFIDDLQWADVASLDMLYYAVRRWAVSDVPVLLLLSLRSEQLATTPQLSDWLAGLGRDLTLTRLTLKPLTAENTVQLVHTLGIGDQESGTEETGIVNSQHPSPLGEHFGQWLFAETSGQPFFIMETLKALMEQDVLALHLEANRKWVVTLDEAAYAENTWRGFLPPGVREVVRARLARLSRTSFGLLVAGAVLGQDFTFEHLCQVAGVGEMEGLPALDEMLTSSILVELESRKGRSGEQTYFFAHDKIRDVVYTEAGDARRRIMHRRAMDVLQAASAPVAELARHALAARLPEPAFRFSFAAGDAAAQLFAHAEACSHYTQALEALSHLPDTETTRRQRVDTLIKLVKVSWIIDDPQRNLARLAEAESLAQVLTDSGDGFGNDRLGLARIHFWMSQVLVTRNEMGEAMRYLQRVLLEAQEEGDEELLALACVQMGRAMTAQGRFGKSKPLLAQAATLLEKAANWSEWIFAASFLGIALAASGQYTAGLAHGQRALARAQEMKSFAGIAVSHDCLSMISFMGGEIANMLEESRAAAAVAEQSGNRLFVYLGYGLQGWAESRLGGHEAATQSMTRSQAVGQSMGGRLLLADWLAAAHAEIVLAAGRVEEALALAEKAVNIARFAGGLFAEGLAYRVWGQALATLNPPRWNEAELRLSASLQALESCEAIPEAARTHLAWGRFCRDNNDLTAALEHFEAAAVQFETAELTRELERTREEIAKCKL